MFVTAQLPVAVSVAYSSYNGYTKSSLKIYQMYTKPICNKKLKI